MRLQQLLYVKEIARCRSMNQAAVRLYIAQSVRSHTGPGKGIWHYAL